MPRLRLDPFSPSGVSIVSDQVTQVVQSGNGYVGTRKLYELEEVDILTTPPTNNQLLSYNSTTGKWVPRTVTGGEGGATDATTVAKGVIQLAGDLTGTAASPSLANTIGSSGTTGSSGSVIPVITYDAKGRITALSSATVNSPSRVATKVVTRDATKTADYTCDGTADDVEIQAAIDSLGTSGGTVVLRSSVNAYRIATTIVLPENVNLIGERMARQSAGGVTLKTAASVTLTNMFTMTGTANPAANADLKHDVHIENITFEGNNTTTNAFMLTNQDTIKFINCRFITSTNSINTTWNHTAAPGAGNIPGGIYLERCNISTVGTGIGIILNYQTQCWISNCWFTASSGTPTAWIKFNASNKIKVTNSEFNTATTALLFTDVYAASGTGLDFPCHNITVSSSVFNTGSTVIDDNRTYPTLSSRVYVSGTMASGTTVGDTLVGTGNTVLIGDGASARSSLGIGNVDNTSDVNKPVSTAQQTALDLKANLASPALTGTPSAPTAAAGTNTTQIATTAYVKTAVDAVVSAAPGALDTLDELAAALGDDANFATTVTNSLAGKLPVSGVTTGDIYVDYIGGKTDANVSFDLNANFLGTLSVSGTAVATQAYVTSAVSAKLERSIVSSSGSFTAGSTAGIDYVYLITGAHNVTLPTASANTNRYTFKNNHSASVTVTRAGTDTVEGATSLTLGASESIDLISNGISAWSVL